jgi:hypothetical protein
MSISICLSSFINLNPQGRVAKLHFLRNENKGMMPYENVCEIITLNGSLVQNKSSSTHFNNFNPNPHCFIALTKATACG